MGLRGFFDIQVAQHRNFGAQSGFFFFNYGFEAQRAGLGFKGEGFLGLYEEAAEC